MRSRYTRHRTHRPRETGRPTRDVTTLIGLAILAVALFCIAIGIATT